MSLNELLSDIAKPWLNIRVNSITVDEGIIFPQLTPNLPVQTDNNGALISELIDLTNDVKNVLPIANGGTNSSTTLTNGKAMISSAGKIIEGSIDLTSQITGILPVANGGTNSSTSLVNNKMIISSGGKIVESSIPYISPGNAYFEGSIASQSIVGGAGTFITFTTVSTNTFGSILTLSASNSVFTFSNSSSLPIDVIISSGMTNATMAYTGGMELFIITASRGYPGSTVQTTALNTPSIASTVCLRIASGFYFSVQGICSPTSNVDAFLTIRQL